MLVDDTAASVATATPTSNATPTPTTPAGDDPSPPLVFDGSCFCQSVSWRIKGKPLISIYCHCTICQRMNGAAFVHGLHFPFTSLTWTTPITTTTTSSNTNKPTIPSPTATPPTPTPPPTVSQTPPNPSHPWIIHRCKSCHSYIGATNTQTHVWSLKSAHLDRDPRTHLIAGFDRIRPTAHIFYGTRMLDVPDGLPKWEGYENRSRRLDLA